MPGIPDFNQEDVANGDEEEKEEDEVQEDHIAAMGNRGKKFPTAQVNYDPKDPIHELECYLKTKTNKFKKHSMVIEDQIIKFHRGSVETDAR